MTIYICKYCKKVCKNPNSLRNHERLCKLNPNRQFTPFSDPEFQKLIPRGQNQYTKAKELGIEYEIKQSTRDKLSLSIKNRTDEFNKAVGRKISKAINTKVKEGTWHTSLAKNMHIDYNGVDLHGSWELAYAKHLDTNNIDWKRNTEHFPYFFEGKWRSYTPDFYLIETFEYIEIKGYKTQKDVAKWTQFPKDKKLITIMKDDMKKMSLI